MKKAVLFLIFAAGVNSSALLFSDDYGSSESWASLGFEYGHFFESYSERENIVESYTGSPGINFGGYRFWNGRNYGIFVHGLVAFPVINLEYTNDVGVKTGLGDYVMTLQTGMLIGPGFRYALDKRLNFKFAVGVGFLSTLILYTKYIPDKGDASYLIDKWSFGIGGDIGTKINITDNVFLSAGGIFTYDFLGHISMETPYGESSGWAWGFYMVGMRPYVAIGMNLQLEH